MEHAARRRPCGATTCRSSACWPPASRCAA
jgi:hypothetical protein